MNKQSMTDLIVSAKAAKNLTWETMGSDLGVSPVWLASACLGMNSAPKEKADAIVKYLDLDSEVASALEDYPTKIWDQTVATDPNTATSHAILSNIN